LQSKKLKESELSVFFTEQLIKDGRDPFFSNLNDSQEKRSIVQILA
jgi:hypothetical protein